ncbi:MAG: POTRA domain-containing protein [Gammaproteobacteria bacterium]
MAPGWPARGGRSRPWLIALFVVLPAGTAFAQAVSNDAGAVQRRALEAVEEQQREQRLREAEEAGRRVPLEAPAAAGIRIPEALRDYRFALKKVELEASAVLSSAEILEVTARFEGREIAFAELQQLVDALNALYDSKGVLARAVLPPQRIQDGSVKIRLIEARVADVKVTANPSTRASYVLNRVDVPRGELLALGALRGELVDFNLRNDVNLRASLAPGTAFGTTDVILHAIEPARWDAQLAFDNAGAESVGRERVALNLTARSLTGFRDRVSAAGIFSEGARTGSLLVDAPVGPWGDPARCGVRRQRDRDRGRTAVRGRGRR